MMMANTLGLSCVMSAKNFDVDSVVIFSEDSIRTWECLKSAQKFVVKVCHVNNYVPNEALRMASHSILEREVGGIKNLQICQYRSR